MAETTERIYRLSVEGQQAINSLNRIAKSAEQVDSRAAKMAASLKGAMAGAAIGGAITAAAVGFKRMAEEMDAIGKAAQKTGVAADELSALGFAAQQSGVEFGTLTSSMGRLNKELADVEKGTSDGAKALRALGVSAGDDTSVALSKISSAFAAMPDSAGKAAVAMAIFGRAGADMIPLLNEGADGIDALKSRAAELGIVLGDETVRQATLFNDKLSEVGTSFKGIVAQVSAGMLPAMSSLAESLASSAKAGSDWQRIGSGLGQAFVFVAKAGQGLVTTVRMVATGMAVLVDAAGKLASGEFAAAGRTLANIGSEMSGVALAGAEAMAKLEAAVGKGGEISARIVNPEDAKRGAESIKAIGTEAGKASGNLKKLKEELTPIQSLLSGLNKQQSGKIAALEQLQFIAQNKGMLEAAYGVKEIAEQIERLRNAAGAGDPLASFTEGIKRMQEEANLIGDKIAIVDAAMSALVESGQTATPAFKALADEMQRLREQAGLVPEKLAEVKEPLDEIGVAIGNTLSNGVGSFVDMLTSSTGSFKEWAASLIKEIGKVLIKLALLKAWQAATGTSPAGGGGIFGNANGNAFRGSTGLPQGVYNKPTFFPMPFAGLHAFANGGMPGLGVLAEAGRSEAIVPLQRHGKDLGVAASPVNVNVINQAGVQVETTSSNNADGSKDIQILIRGEMKRAFGDGSMDSMMRQQYGMRRAPA